MALRVRKVSGAFEKRGPGPRASEAISDTSPKSIDREGLEKAEQELRKLGVWSIVLASYAKPFSFYYFNITIGL